MIGVMVRLAATAVGAAVVTKAGERAAAHMRTQAELYAMKVAAKKAKERWEASPAGKALNTFKSVFIGKEDSEIIDVELTTTEGEKKMFGQDTKEKLRDATGAALVAAKATFHDVKVAVGPTLTKVQAKGAEAFDAARGKIFEIVQNKAGGRDER